MVDILNRNLSFFRLLRNDKRIIESFDLDSQFASVIDYLNNVIVPAVNDMQAGALPGINGSANYFITNVGDGNVTFNTLDKVIPDKTIGFTKMEKSISQGQVLVSNNVGNLGLVTNSQYNNMVLACKKDNIPEYRFIKKENIEDRAITYADIADKSIIKEHLSQEILSIIDAPVPDQTITETLNITGNNFNDLSITTNKFAQNTITTFNKLGIIPNTLPNFPSNESLYWSKIIQHQHVKNGTITPNKIKPGTIGARHFNRVQCITKNKLAPGIIDDLFLKLKENETYTWYSVEKAYRYFPFTTRILSPNFRIQRRHLYLNSDMRPTDFEPTVAAALRKHGCT
jgi:hypothetical protein